MPNRLLYETSLYLRQHATNPVDWYPWGSEALEKARREDKPILLSVGYSACHWCHVMAHECFADPRIAQRMNEDFVNVKVDREERPDVDEVYQRVAQILTGTGGWPLTVFLTPDLKPLYGGTYFPPEDRYGRPGFPRVLAAVADTWRNRRTEAVQEAEWLTAHLSAFDRAESGTGVPGFEVLTAAERVLVANFDPRYGGFGGAPKFPHAADLLVLLSREAAEPRDDRRARILFTLRSMAAGGIYDQLGGGFHRYAVDAAWRVPHFEKMLYDNALLPQVYLEAYRLTGDAGSAQTARETLHYLLREMRSPEGGFYSSQDADSEGVEGKYYVWSEQEIRRILAAELATPFCLYYGVKAQGNWEHTNILHVEETVASLATRLQLDPDDLAHRLAAARQRLLAVRSQRVPPGRDDKIIAAWNGLTLSALSYGAALLGDVAFVAAALHLGKFLSEAFWDGRRLCRLRQGTRLSVGFLDDYAYVTAGLLDLHRATGQAHWVRVAASLAEAMVVAFRDTSGIFYLTTALGEGLPSRPMSGMDMMLPAPAGVAIHALLRLHTLTGRAQFRDWAEQSLAAYAPAMGRHPSAHAALLLALDRYLRGDTACVIVGEAAPAAALAAVARRCLRMDDALLEDEDDSLAMHLRIGKTASSGGAAAYLCSGFTCQPPVEDPQVLAEMLGRGRSL